MSISIERGAAEGLLSVSALPRRGSFLRSVSSAVGSRRPGITRLRGWVADNEAVTGAPAEEEPLTRIILRRLVRNAKAEATTPALGRLLIYQASGAAGDTLVALGLAGSLFFAVPDATARARVGLYLALTVAPFALVAPFLARLLDDHRGSLRVATVVAALGRSALAWLLATRLESILLFPLGFGMLVLARGALIVRGALLPSLVAPDQNLVSANAALSKATAVAGMTALLPGLALLRWAGPSTALMVAAVVYLIGAVPAFGLPRARGRRAPDERLGARAMGRSAAVRRGLLAVATMRFLVGLLVLHLAFALKRDELGSVGLGALVAAAAAGTLLGALLAPRARGVLHEEGMVVSSLALSGIAAIAAGRWFSVASAAALVFVFGAASGAGKVGFDAIVQRDVPEAGRGWAFARFESILQLSWVVGAAIPLVITLPSGPGVMGAGALALLMAIFVGVVGLRARSARVTRDTPTGGPPRQARRGRMPPGRSGPD